MNLKAAKELLRTQDIRGAVREIIDQLESQERIPGKRLDFKPLWQEPATGIEAEVCGDIAMRQQAGIIKYGVTVAENPLELEEWLQHAYEETLDKAIYLKAAIKKLKARKTIFRKRRVK